MFREGREDDSGWSPVNKEDAGEMGWRVSEHIHPTGPCRLREGIWV